MKTLEVCIYEPIRPVLAEWSDKIISRGGVVALTAKMALPVVENILQVDDINFIELSGGVIHDCIWWFAFSMVKRGVKVAVVADQIIFADEWDVMSERSPSYRYEKVLFYGGEKLRKADERGKIWSRLSTT